MARVVIGMSGGVDSSVSAYLLKKQGHEVQGIFMKNWEEDDNDEYCSSRQDWLDALSVADKIGIDIDAMNFSLDYKNKVFSNFLKEYEAGRTPNPDIFCNSEIKFKAFLDYAMSIGADYIATGHYARIEKINEITYLKKAVDTTKDQSYFLYRLNQYQLQKSIFPLGNMHKNQVREIAKQLDLHNALKKDSTGICFIGKRPFREFLNKYVANKQGIILNQYGIQIGTHIGLAFYTLGQRKGIGIGGSKDDISGEPWFVARKDIQNNILYVVQGHQHPWLLSKNVKIENISYTYPVDLNINWQGSAKTRYRQQDAYCTITNISNDSNDIEFSQEQWAVTPGQSLVLYNNDICLGGGIIV